VLGARGGRGSGSGGRTWRANAPPPQSSGAAKSSFGDSNRNARSE